MKSWAISRTRRWNGKLADEQLRGLLVAADLAEGDGSRPVAVGLLDASGGGGRLACGLGGELLAGGLASGGLAGGLLGACHFCLWLCLCVLWCSFVCLGWVCVFAILKFKNKEVVEEKGAACGGVWLCECACAV